MYCQPAVQAVLVVFIFRVFSRHYGYATDWENWNENAGGSTVFLIQDGGLNNVPMGISTGPAKICLRARI